jgi:hypothetical protein
MKNSVKDVEQTVKAESSTRRTSTRKKVKVKKTPSLRKAINDYCTWCIFDPKDSGSRLIQIHNCKNDECPLYLVRPKSTSTKVDSDDMAQT